MVRAGRRARREPAVAWLLLAALPSSADYLPIPCCGPSDLRDLGLNLTGVYAQQYDVISPLTREIRRSERVLAAARPFVRDGRVTLAWAWDAMRVCVSRKGETTLTVGRAAVDSAAQPTDDVVSSEYALLWLMSERVTANYGHFINGLLNSFAAARDAGFIREPAAGSAHGWRIDPAATFVLNPLGSLMLARRFDEIATLVFGPLARMQRPTRLASKRTARCTRLPTTVYGAGAAGMGNIWDYFADAGVRVRTRAQPHFAARRWRAREVVPAFQRYVRAQLGVPTLVPRPPPLLADGRVRKLILVEQRRIDGEKRGLAERHIVNLNELLRLGAELGAQSRAFAIEARPVEFGALPFKDTVRLLADADAIVGVEGSGLTNVLFLRPGSALVNIKPFPQCDSDAYDADSSHFLADAHDGPSGRAPHAGNQMFGLYGSFEKLALAVQGPIHVLPICAPREAVEYRWGNTRATRLAIAAGEVDAHGLPALTHRSHLSDSKLMRQMWFINGVHGITVDAGLFRATLHALHHIWMAADFEWARPARQV
ncbi:hypothetical protein KFE25_001528 [Diacronema lutheri]|uniref:Glycosyltransferase 61 catalytic domain-containing protein n=1 Tax=Diacronema lutheri TaxID=2081491 RepID=A0A8J5X4P2_DIALT|nr:hypothetical protein KFE25_001528 [Diacronema lutheri]